jgi:glyoxylase-like metal-dependent hydrolase (beta-lactamase superfamily II)
MQQVSANVYVETSFRGCNPGFVVTGDGIVMIDSPQNPSDCVKWREKMKAKGDVRYLINTEPHGDHYTGNSFFPGTVIAHQGTREAITSMRLEDIVERVRAIDPEGLPLMDGYELKIPSITFSQRLTLHLGNHSFELIHLPGHTASETAIHIPQERVVFTGDNVFYKVQLFFHEAYPREWLESLKRLEELDVDIIVPGHGEVCNKSYLSEQAGFIEEWIGAVREAVKQGLTKEETQGKISFLDRYPMGPGLEAMGPMLQQMNISRLYDLIKEGVLP